MNQSNYTMLKQNQISINSSEYFNRIESMIVMIILQIGDKYRLTQLILFELPITI